MTTTSSADPLPISVVVPLLERREEFFRRYVLPSIEANNPAEILVLPGLDSVQDKRNKGAEVATGQFVFFCDDDIILAEDCLSELYGHIDIHDFAYCDYLAANHPTPGFLRHTAKPYDEKALFGMNYISTMSLVRRSKFRGFDPLVPRLQDWDMFLNMIINGGSTGVYVPSAQFIACWGWEELGGGITRKGDNSWTEANVMIRKKYGLPNLMKASQ